MEKNRNPKYIAMKLLRVFMTLFLMLMVGMTFINAVMRYIFGSNSMYFEEYARFCFVWACYLGIILAFVEKRHICVTFLTDLIKKPSARRRLDIFIYIVCIAVLCFVLYGGIIYTLQAATYNTAATKTNFAIVTIGLPLMAACSIGVLIKDLYSAITKKGG